MLNSSILDVAIGMAFIYLLLSLIASTIQEAIASLLQFRSANLERGIRSLFSDGRLADNTLILDRLYRHGLVMGLYREREDGSAPAIFSKAKRWLLTLLRHLFRVHPGASIKDVADPFLLPAYIPARTFAIALLDILKTAAVKDAPKLPPPPPVPPPIIEGVLPESSALAPEPPIPSGLDPFDQIGAYLENLCLQQKAIGATTTAHSAAEALLALLNDAYDIDSTMPPLEKFRCHIENWYNDSMDRASGWYKKYTQNILLLIGLILAILFNVDSITVGKKLWFDKDARSGLAAAAGNYIQQHPRPERKKPVTGTAAKTPTAKAAKDQSTTPDASMDKADTTADTADASSPATACAEEQHTADATLCQKVLTDQMKTTIKSYEEVSASYLLPVGWHYSYDEYVYQVTHRKQWQPVHIASQVAGWLITALALSLGAPFWFDLLNKFMVVRSTVKPQEKSRTEGSKDAA